MKVMARLAVSLTFIVARVWFTEREIRQLLLLLFIVNVIHCLQCFDAVRWAAGRASGQ